MRQDILGSEQWKQQSAVPAHDPGQSKRPPAGEEKRKTGENVFFR